MEKDETLSFPTVIGFGGREQSLYGEILVGAKGLRSWFLRSLRCEIQLRTFLRDRNTQPIPTYFSTYQKTMSWRDELWFVGVLIVTRCDLLGPIVIFHTFMKCCVLRYYYYVGTGYGFFSSTAAHDWRIFTIASIRSPDKEHSLSKKIILIDIEMATLSQVQYHMFGPNLCAIIW